MTKISEKISFHTALGNQVRLHDHYYDEEENRLRLGGYMPIRSHREAFLKLAAAQLPDRTNKDKVFMLTGSYGTGKSHLCLMLANYFSLKISSPDLQSFLDNWNRRDQVGVNMVRNMRGDGRFLVAICEFGTGRPFEDMILSAIEEALEMEGVEEISLNSLFKAAQRWIDERELQSRLGERSGIFTDFLDALGGDDPDEELDALKQDLAANSSRAMESFQKIYGQITGQRFTIRADSLQDVLRDLMRSDGFRQRYLGLVILADEFGYALSENRVPISVFQAFAEMSKDGVDGLPLIFIGVGHRRFEAYGAGTALQADFRVVRDRVTEVSLQSEELEQIIAALISPAEDWKQTIKSQYIFTTLANEARKAHLFEYLSEPELLDQIVCGIYPMHPMAVYSLTKMSQELGSDARSVFSFFRQSAQGRAPGSYPSYVEETEIYKPNGDFNIYTPELLATYFEPEIQTNNTSVRPEVHDHIRNYRAALEEAEKIARGSFSGMVDTFTRQVLDLMFVYLVSGTPTTGANLRVGLNLFKPAEQKQLEGELKSLQENKIIFLGNGGEFEFRRSNMADLDSLIASTRAGLASNPFNPSEQITTQAADSYEVWTVGAEHNTAYHGDKRLRRVFATPLDLIKKFPQADGTELSIWQKLEKDRSMVKTWGERYEGVMVYVLCETQEDIINAQQAVRSNDTPTIIVGIPHSPMPVYEKILDLLSVQSFMNTLEYNKLGDQEKSLVEEKLGREAARRGCIGEVIKAREKYLSAADLVWYQQNGNLLINSPSTSHQPADALLSRLYTKRNFAEHTILNLTHGKFSGVKEIALRDAVKHLLAFDRPVEIDANDKESQGEIRYLKNVLVNNGVLYQTGDYSGSRALYQLTTNLESYRGKFTALVDMVQKFRSIGRGEKLNVWPYLYSLTDAPYGIGPFGLCLFLAVTVRYLGDEMRIKLNPTGLGYADLRDPDTIIDLATGKYPTATVERRERTIAVIKMADDIHAKFTETPAAAGTHCSQSDAWRAMLEWWKKRTRLEQTSGIYPPAGTARNLAQMLTENETITTASQSFLEKIKAVYGYSEDADLDVAQVDELIQKLEQDKIILETYAGTIKDNLIRSIATLFSPEGDTYLDYSDAIRRWANGLHEDQKDKNATWRTNITITLIEALPTLTDVKKMLLDDIPAASSFGLGRVDNWGYDRSEEYINKFKNGLQIIADGLPKVDPPTYTIPLQPEDSKTGDPVFKFHTKIDVQIHAPAGVIVRVAKNEDPKTAKQFEIINGGTTWSTSITESSSLQIVSQNAQGEYSKIVRLVFRDLDDDFKIIPEQQGKLNVAERFYSFRNPVNAQGLTALLNDLLKHLVDDGLIPQEEIQKVLTDILNHHLNDHME